MRADLPIHLAADVLSHASCTTSVLFHTELTRCACANCRSITTRESSSDLPLASSMSLLAVHSQHCDDALVRLLCLQYVHPLRSCNAMQCNAICAIMSMLFIPCSRQLPLLLVLFVSLNLIADFKSFPSFESHTAFGALSHLRHVFLDVLQARDDACRPKS